jgi:predicted alpha/beta superfamily hydrolase
MRISIFILLILSLSCTSYSQTSPPKQNGVTKPFVLGVIDEIPSTELGENRTLNIYLPEGYKQDDTTHYPVIYLLDGSADEDFIHIVGLVQFNSFEWVNRVPRSIVVGIANVDRKRDFTYPTTVEADKKRSPTSGHSDKFIAFIEKELQPFIDKKYKTNSSRTLIGESLGGLLAVEILFKKPGLFSKYIIVSPSLWWDNASLLKLSPDILKDTFKQKIDIYIGVGKEGLAPTEEPHVMETEADLLQKKIKSTKSKNVSTYLDHLPDEDHATIAHQAVMNAFRILYPGNK